MVLQVVDYHIEKHERAHTTRNSLVKMISFAQVCLQHKVEWPEFWETHLHMKSSDDAFEAVLAIKADVRLKTSLSIFNL